ncbi:hypothetical protein LZ554_001288 [Drepanopeziza brunnea f. sp. 'monogermtubi']|nr:hypothetical protein LZ554_001288 [Drepanopeziza brunnea f. sp. 'monogermtubi']
MKYSERFHKESVPQWAPFNVDYIELKNLIKLNTTRNQGQAIAIPGQADPRLEKFEKSFFDELKNQHNRVDLFVKNKADEYTHWLNDLQKQVVKLLERTTRLKGGPIPEALHRKYIIYNDRIERCGEEITSLERFQKAQREAFRKILKKYKKWTGSATLGERFDFEVLNRPDSFTKFDLDELRSRYRLLSASIRSSTPPPISGTTSPSSSRRPSRRSSTQVSVQRPPRAYWNEYDNGSEAEDEPFTIYVNPDADSFPGAKAVELLLEKIQQPMKSVKSWFSPGTSPSAETRPLLRSRDSYFHGFNDQNSPVDTEDDAYASSNEFPAGYATHYATFPSIKDQRFSRSRETWLFRIMLGSYAGSLILIFITSILFSTGRRKLMVEVDAGAVAGCVASLCFALGGIMAALCRQEKLGWLHITCVWVAFMGLFALNLMLLFLVLSNIRS